VNVIRAFLAVNLNVSVLRRVNDVQRALRDRCAEDGWDIKWVAPPNLHVVVRYLGEVGEALPDPLAEAVTPHIRRLPPFPLRAHGVRIDEGGKGPRVVAGIEDSEGGMDALRAALAAPLEEIGFKPLPVEGGVEMVLGRVRQEGETPLGELASAAAEADFGESIVTELAAYRSDLAVPRFEFRDLFRVRLTGRRVPKVAAASPKPSPAEAAASDDEAEAPVEAPEATALESEGDSSDSGETQQSSAEGQEHRGATPPEQEA